VSNELLWIVLLVANFGGILVAFRLFGRTGLIAWMVLSIIAANIQVTKTIELFGITATLGNIVYASSFLITDIFSENYGIKAARRLVVIGFVAIVGFTILMNVSLFFAPAPSDFADESLQTVFSILPRIAGASLLAYIASQLHDVWAYAMWKRLVPGERKIWIRNNASTLVSQLIDSVIFVAVAFIGVFPIGVLLEILLTTYVLKLIVAAADTPLVYLATHWLRRGLIPDEPETLHDVTHT
jgi:uncharacterized integral membrane protein (TIGR00697 family)